MDHLTVLQQFTRYLDGQASAEEIAEVEALLAAREDARRLMDRLREAMRMIRLAVLNESPPPAAEPGEGCLDEPVVLRLAEGSAEPRERRRAEAHLAACDRCLALVVEFSRSSTSMREGQWPDIPDEVARQRSIRGLVHFQEREPADEAVQSLVIDATADRTVRHHVRCAGLELHAQFSPASGRGAQILLSLRDPAHHRAGRLVTIADNRSGRKVFTGRTESDGSLSVRRLPAGRYTLHIDNSKLKLDLTVEA
jgi:anti-sigma factor RsiW